MRPERGKGQLGHYRATFKYNRFNQISEITYADEKGQPARHADGHAKWVADYDERGNQIEVKHLDGTGKLMRIKPGYARIVYDYDPRGVRMDSTYFDEAGKAVAIEVVVRSVNEGSHGMKLGLRTGDVLMSYAGKPVRTTNAFIYGRASEAIGGARVELVVRRNGESMTFSVMPGMLGVELADQAKVP